MRGRLICGAFVILALCSCSLPFGTRLLFSPKAAQSVDSPALDDSRIHYWVGSFESYGGAGVSVGCDSYLYPVDSGQAQTGDAADDMRVALEALFDPQQTHEFAETAAWLLDLGLRVESIDIEDGMAEIRLGGRLRGIGTCGDAILEAQIMQTIFQFAEIERARITDGVMNLRQITDMSDRFSQAELRDFIYTRADF